MSSPALTTEQIRQLRDRLQQMAGMHQLPTGSAAGARIYTIDDGMKLAEHMAQALDNHQRLPISTTVTRNDDGSLTIHVSPDPTAAEQPC
ncbi:hypothetical protein [Mycobacterium botniense]|uniref:Uncharacterized protein n=1 Tax=Mycobacterium botniense TaxID=84962 RepID=A0A7I9XTL0_9MYCO|nr:hypothetical protein [Mycobacterium botniense]GFG72706.1 hypothetical protein MBOT_00710 [Mycobacterium botniense]